MGVTGPKPHPPTHALSLRVPEAQWAVYRAEAERVGLSWNLYVCSVLARVHGLDPVGEQRPIDPQFELPLDEGKAKAA